MSLFLASLQRETRAYSVEPNKHGFALRRKPDCNRDFDDVVRLAMDASGCDFVALPVTDGQGGYESVVVITLDP